MWYRSRALALLLVSLSLSCSTPPELSPPPDTPALLELENIELRDLPEETPLVSGYLSAKSAPVRARAARALGRSTFLRDCRPLALLLEKDGDPEARREAAFALGLSGDPASAASLKGAARDPDPRVRAAVARALGRLPVMDPRSLEGLLDDPDPLVRREAVYSIFSSGGTLSKDRLENLAAESDERVRWAFFRALGSSPVSSSQLVNEPVFELKDPNFLAATFKLEALRAVPEAARVEEILSIARDPNRFFLEREAAFHTLASYLEKPDLDRLPGGRVAIAGFLEEMARDPPSSSLHPLVKRRLLAALGRSGREAASPLPSPPAGSGSVEELLLLGQELESSDPGTWPRRLAALDRLVERGGREALPLLERAIQDPVPEIARIAWKAVERIEGAPPSRGLSARGPPPYPFFSPALHPVIRNPRAEVRVRGRGELVLELFQADAPHHVSSFRGLASTGYYSGRIIQRVEPSLGVFLATPAAGAHPIAGKPLPRETHPRSYPRGAVLSVPALGLESPRDYEGGKKSPVSAAGSLLLAHVPLPELEGAVTCWGQVVLGMEVLDQLEEGDVIEGVQILCGK
jgi:peptidyl-prolyl cis-trans isomerase B (cyclophilin B)